MMVFQAGLRQLWREYILSRYSREEISREEAIEAAGIDWVELAERQHGAMMEDLEWALGNMRLKVDKESNALYFRLDESAIVESEEVQPGVILDFNAEGHVVGIEILHLSSRVAPGLLRTLHFETV